jgi:hypothetical protein
MQSQHFACPDSRGRNHSDHRIFRLLKLLQHLWKDADPDIPILEEAKAEYAKLQ